jgi:hypothetical protein
MKSHLVTLVLALSMTTVLAATPRLAAADEQGEDSRAKARRLFNDGLDLRKDGKHLEALAKFREADALVTTPKTRLELGRELVALERYVEATTTLESVSSLSFDPKDAGKYEPARKEAAALATEAARHISRIHLVLSSGARDLTIDGRPILAKTGDVQVDPGRHDLTATVNDTPWHLSVETEPGKTANVEVAGDRVAGEASSKTSHGPPTLAVALFIGGGVSLLGGVALGLSAKSTYADSEPHCGIGGDPNACNDEGLSLRHTAGARADLSTGLFVLGAGLAVGGLVVWWIGPKESGAPTATAGVRVGPGSLSLDGRF